MFCPGCGLIQDRSTLGMRISTDETRGRALEDLDRQVGLYDSDDLAEAKAREFSDA
jgi:hypothetical protein